MLHSIYRVKALTLNENSVSYIIYAMSRELYPNTIIK